MTVFMAKTTRKINPQAESEGHNKELCLKYFQALFRIYTDDLKPGIREPAFFWKIYLQYIDIWAPYLLSFERMYNIGIDTARLLQDSIFKDLALIENLSEKEVGLEKRRATAIRKLFNGCAARAQDKIQNGDPSQRAMGPIMSAMKSCVDYLSLLAEGSNVFLTELRDSYDQDIVDQYDGQFSMTHLSSMLANLSQQATATRLIRCQPSVQTTI